MDTTAVRSGGRWIINGRKQFISNGYDASLYIVYANTDRAAGLLQGTSSFLVPRDTPGLQVTRCNETVGGRFMNNGEIVFEDCRVPEDHVLAHGDALGQAGVYFRPGKIIQAAKNLGIGIAAFDDTAAFVQQRVQGGRIPIEHRPSRSGSRRWRPSSRRSARCCGRPPARWTRTTPTPPGCATWSRCSRRRRSCRSASTPSNCTAATGRCWRWGSRSTSAMPRCTCTWTRPSTCRTSRSPRRCSPARPGLRRPGVTPAAPGPGPVASRAARTGRAGQCPGPRLRAPARGFHGCEGPVPSGTVETMGTG